MSETEPGKPAAPITPRDAATLIIYRRDADAIRLLMGRRSMKHVFMPGALVFPGGRVDRQDLHAPSLDALEPSVEAWLLRRTRIRPARARALALAAIRETFEETGILVGQRCACPTRPLAGSWQEFAAHGVLPSLSGLQFLLRAITPPGSPRRFDARFFVAEASSIVHQVDVPDEELEAPSWVTFEEARSSANLVTITRMVLDRLERMLEGGREAHKPELIWGRARGSLISEPL